MSHRFCVLLLMETNDPRLQEGALGDTLESGSAAAFARLRTAVLSRLPKDVVRLVAIMPVEEAQMLTQLHEIMSMEAAEQMTGDAQDGEFGRAPPDYIPPSRE